MDARQAEFLRKRIADAARTEPRWRTLRETLLALGGEEIVVGVGDYFDGGWPTVMTKRARLFGSDRVLKVPGVRGECHHNTAALCAGEQLWRFVGRKNFPKIKIATGWALFSDGLWRNHSWGVAEDGTVVETTVPWAMYYGVTLSPAEAGKFIRIVGLSKRR